jgi:hypothetical protein
VIIIARLPKSRGSNWEAIKIKLKKKYPQLTDADLNFDESRKTEMLTKLQVTLGKTFKELRDIIDAL